MAELLVQSDSLTDIADAIREKAESTDPLVFPTGFIDALAAIGGGGDINAFIDRSITEVNIPEGVTKIGDFAFRSCTKLTSVTLPSTLKTIGSSAFYSTEITTLDVPNGVTTINSNAYTSCTNLTTVFLPDTVTDLDTQCFRYDTKISKVTMGEGINSIGAYCFSGCIGLNAVIIRKTASVCPLSNTNAFSSSAISGKTGYIYVPSALVESYKASTNWITYASQFRAIEDYPEITGG